MLTGSSSNRRPGCAHAVLLLTLITTAVAGGGEPAYGATDRAEPAGDVRELSFAADDLVLRIERSGKLLADPALDAYLQTVANRLLASDPRHSNHTARVRALRDPYSNAYALPNGHVFITTGLLHRLESEAQLACVLGHELTHFTNSHSLKQKQSTDRKAAWSRTMAVLFAAAVGAAANDAQIGQAAANLAQGVQGLWLQASISGYSQDLEREADREGLQRMRASGYDLAEGAEVFKHLMSATAEESDSSVTPYFSSHPKLEERLMSHRALLNEQNGSGGVSSGQVGRDEYRERVRGLGMVQVRVLLDADRLQRADAILTQEMAAHESGVGFFLRGEIERRRIGDPSASERSLAAYTQAVSFPDAPADAFRQKGMMHRVRGEHEAALLAFSEYLNRMPNAPDAPIVRMYLNESNASGAEVARKTAEGP